MNTIANRIRSRLEEKQIHLLAATKVHPDVFLARRNHSDQRELAHCDSQGFYAKETIHGHRYNWTSGYAVLSCNFSTNVKLSWLWIELAPGPIRSEFEIRVNGQSVLSHCIGRKRCFRVRLKNSVDSMNLKLEVLSNTFYPQTHFQNSTDGRQLGVLVGEICFARYWWRNIRSRRVCSSVNEFVHDTFRSARLNNSA